jgi:tRNA wybutosine-synthesizing protein 3
MTFQQQKQKQLAKLDISNVGSWDRKILGLCNKLNRNPNYYTTSSCAGRIILIIADEKKKPGLFVFRSHDKISLSQLKHALAKAQKSKNVEFRQEPCILHVACKSLEDAQSLFDKAKFAGWKRSGIIATRKRFICELMSTEHLALPIIQYQKILVDNEFLKILVHEANKKLERTWKKIKNLENLF